MIDEYALILVLFAIYLSECVFFPSPDALLFSRSIGGSWRVDPTPPPQVTSRYRLVVEGLLPLRGGIVVAESEPPLISPSGICCSQRTGAVQIGQCIDLPEAGPFTSKDCAVWSGPTQVLSLATADQAQHLVELLSRVKASSIPERDSLITHTFHRMLDTRRAARRWKAYKKVSRLLALDSWILFCTLLVFSVVLAPLRFQLAAAWPLAIIALVVLPHTAYLFYRIHLMFFPHKALERWKQIALMFLTPPAAIRASDLIAREIFAGFHSLAVARVLLDDVKSRDFTTRILREMLYPLDQQNGEETPEVAKWTRQRWTSIVWEWTRQEFGDPQKLIHTPPKESPTCVCYCPRCLTQYVALRSYCSDCPTVATLSF